MPRLKRMLNPFQEEHGGVYHCISRVVKREEKEKFVQLIQEKVTVRKRDSPFIRKRS